MNIVRYYNQNRKKIWGILIIIASAFLIFQLVKIAYKNTRTKDDTVFNNTNTINTNSTSLGTEKSVITGEKLATAQLKKDTEVIDQFITYCNNKELEKAYDLLTDECKSQMYSTLEVFEQAYYQDVFEGEKKSCTVENWISDTYKVNIKEDILSNVHNNNYSKQDYITVKKVGDSYQLNINRYIGTFEINKTTEQNDISMKVISKNTYMDYEEYTIRVTNKTDYSLLLDTKTYTDTLYIEDSKEKKYPAYMHELTDPMLNISSGATKDVKIKFYNSYSSNKHLDNIVFSNVFIYDDSGYEKRIQFKANV